VGEYAAHDDARDAGRLLLLEQHPDAAVPTADAAVELGVLLRRQEFAVRVVELAHESVRRLLEDRPALQRVDVAVGDERDHLIEQPRRRRGRPPLQEEAAGDQRYE
jgi:hypothetical protein